MSTQQAPLRKYTFSSSPESEYAEIFSQSSAAGNRPANFTQKKDAEERSPLAGKLFAVPGICGVMIGKNFVTVTKTEDGDWDVVHKGASSVIETHLSEGGIAVNPTASPRLTKAATRTLKNALVKFSTTRFARPSQWTAATSPSKNTKAASFISTCKVPAAVARA